MLAWNSYGRGRPGALELSPTRSKLVVSRTLAEGAHPAAAAESRWLPDEPTRQELRAALFHPHYGSQVS